MSYMAGFAPKKISHEISEIGLRIQHLIVRYVDYVCLVLASDTSVAGKNWRKQPYLWLTKDELSLL